MHWVVRGSSPPLPIFDSKLTRLSGITPRASTDCVIDPENAETFQNDAVPQENANHSAVADILPVMGPPAGALPDQNPKSDVLFMAVSNLNDKSQQLHAALPLSANGVPPVGGLRRSVRGVSALATRCAQYQVGRNQNHGAARTNVSAPLWWHSL